MKYLFLVTIISFVFACNSGSDHDDSHKDSADHTAHTQQEGSGNNAMKDMHDAMNNMMQKMQSMKATGDADYDFAMMMKHHHEGAIDMAKAEVGGGTDAQLKQMAQKMIDDQQKEIDQFNQFMQGNQPTGNSDYGQKAMGMMTPMSEIKMESGSLDAMFASMMIPHHQDAVKMAKEYLKVAKNQDMKKIATNINQTQPKEIQELQSWLKNQKK